MTALLPFPNGEACKTGLDTQNNFQNYALLTSIIIRGSLHVFKNTILRIHYMFSVVDTHFTLALSEAICRIVLAIFEWPISAQLCALPYNITQVRSQQILPLEYSLPYRNSQPEEYTPTINCEIQFYVTI